MDECIPTIFDEEALPSSRGPNIAPSTELILAVAKRARKEIDYWIDLGENGIFIGQVQYPIADALHAKYQRKTFIKNKEQADDNEKKTGKRWNEKKGNRTRQLNRLTEVVGRKLLATETSARFKADTKEHDYYEDLLKELAHIFSSTTKPYRLIAATLLLFNLSSRMPCKDCQHICRSRGPKPKNQTVAFDVARGNNLCKPKRLFKCPDFSKIENKVRKALKRSM